jgi:SAM-dependent methyltransferase
MLHGLPPEFDPKFYRSSYADLRELSDVDLRLHYETYGRNEGRCATPAVPRDNFVSIISEFENALEIGPLNRPILSGPKVRYFDVLTTSELKMRAATLGESPEGVPQIDFVSMSGSLADLPKGFDIVVSSHCIEHQPDLVRHLSEVENLLCPDGCYCLIIPDCRYCFDHFIAPSTIARVLEAYDEKRQLHTLASLIEHRVLTCHNDPLKHWESDSGERNLSVRSIEATLREWESWRGQYIDVHAWQFTPSTFREIVSLLNGLKLTSLTAERVYDTPFGGMEFFAILRRASLSPV